MSAFKPEISIIIVNYKVKYYVQLLIESVKKASKNISVEILIVDNNSNDGSNAFLKNKHPDVLVIENKENLGFGRANNIAIDKAKGRFIYLINPDTIIQENTLQVFKNFLDNNTEYGAVGGKIINPDGSFAKESKRSLPDINSAVFRVLNLDTAFSKNRIIGRRYLGWLPESEPADVFVISGASMFWRASVIKELGGFDEDFFAYGEDDDICLRAINFGYKIKYLPSTSVLHFKGKSRDAGNFKQFNKVEKGIFTFFEKHFSKNYGRSIKVIIWIVFLAKVMVGYLTFLAKKALIINKGKNREAILITSQSHLNGEIKNIEKRYISSFKVLDIKEEQIEMSSLFSPINKNLDILFDVRSLSFRQIFSLIENISQSNRKAIFKYVIDHKIISKSEVTKL